MQGSQGGNGDQQASNGISASFSRYETVQVDR